MYCNACGQAIADQARYCSHCGHVVGHPNAVTRLIRPRFDRKIAGVCAAFSHHLDLDVSLVRILWVFLTFAAGCFPGVVAYVLAWIIIPEEPALPPVPAVANQQTAAG